MQEQIHKIQACVDFLKSKITASYQHGVILGSGLGNLTKEIKIHVQVPYREIPNFPVSTVSPERFFDFWRIGR